MEKPWFSSHYSALWQERFNILIKGGLLFFLTMLTLSPLHAWARHNLITKYALYNHEIYKNSLTVITEISPDDSVNPEYNPVYITPDLKDNKVDCDRFINYDLDNGLYYGFKGRKPGEMTSIYEILVNFSDEPDWGMDRELILSFAQNFMAGSQGYRHMYYPFWTFHLPYPLIAQGEAPERAQHFFNRALDEYRKGNIYSAYRELARSMHYVMDVAQPFHTKQLYYRFIQFSSPFDGTVQAIKNYHFAYETFVANFLQMEDCGFHGVLLKGIVSAEPIDASDPEDLAKKISQKSHRMAKRLMSLSIDTFGERFNSKEPQTLTEREFEEILQDKARLDSLLKITEEALNLTSGGIKGLLKIFEEQKE